MPEGGWLHLGLRKDVGQARERKGAAQSRAGYTHTHTHTSTLAAGPGEQMGLEGEGEQDQCSGTQGSGWWGSRLPSSVAGGQPLPTQPGGHGSYLVVAGESWPPKDPWDHSQGRWKQPVPCSPVGLPGSKPPASSPLQAGHVWHHAAATASFARWHGDQLAAGPFTPVPLPMLGGSPAQEDGTVTRSSVPHLGGQVSQPSL